MRSERGAVHPAIPAGVAVLVCAVAVMLLGRDSGSDSSVIDPGAASSSTTEPTSDPTNVPTTDSTTSTTIPPDPVPVEDLVAAGPGEAPPSGYVITYDIVENELPRTETWTVRRPYESLVESDRGDGLLSGSATSRTNLYTYLADREGWLPLEAELHRASFDQRPAAAIASLVRLGLAAEIGTASYVGRDCIVYETGQPLSANEPTPASDEERTEFCLDDEGLVLHTAWTLNGNPVIERTATAVDTDPASVAAVDASRFDPEPLVDDPEQFSAILGSVAAVADQSTLDSLATDVAVPDGYALDEVVIRASTGGTGTVTGSEVIRFLSAGPDLIEVVEVGSGGSGDLGGGASVPVSGVDHPDFDEVWFEPGFRFSAVRVPIDAGRFLEIRGSDPATLFAMLDGVSLR